MFLSLKLSNVQFNFVYNCTVYYVHCPSRFERFYLDLTLASDPDFSKQHQMVSLNKKLTLP